MIKRDISVKQEIFTYIGPLSKRLTVETLSYLKDLIEDSHQDVKVIFNYEGTSYNSKQLAELEGKNGQLELTVIACKANDNNLVTQRHNNENARMCFGAISEYLRLRFPSKKWR